MRISERDQQAAIAQAELGVLLDRYAREHGLTTAEMLAAVTSWQGTCLKFMVRSERSAPRRLLDSIAEGERAMAAGERMTTLEELVPGEPVAADPPEEEQS